MAGSKNTNRSTDAERQWRSEYRIAANLKCLRRNHDYTLNDIVTILDLPSRSTWHTWERGSSQPSLKHLLKIIQHFDISLEQLLYADMCKEPVVGQPLKRKNAGFEVSLVDINVAAGYTNSYNNPNYIEGLPAITIPFKPPRGDVRAFPVAGDSMEPKINDGSYVVAVKVENMRQVKDGEPYIVVTRTEGITLKIVYNRLFDNGTLELHSLNYKKHPPFRVPGSQVFEVWKYFCSIEKEL